MSENCQDTLRCDPQDLQQAMSIHTRKITDSCRDKDCIEDLRVYLTKGSQALLDASANAKVRCAELLYTYIDVEPVAFDRNHYCIDVTFYYRVLADATIGAARPAALYGLAVFTKRAVLCGEDSAAHIFRSDTRLCAADGATRYRANAPTAVVEVTDTNSQNTKPAHIQNADQLIFSPQSKKILIRSAYLLDFGKVLCYNAVKKKSDCGKNIKWRPLWKLNATDI